MLKFITSHYLIIMIVSLFLIFALIGYLIDSIRNKKDDIRVDKKDEISPVFEEEIIEDNDQIIIEEPDEEVEEEFC